MRFSLVHLTVLLFSTLASAELADVYGYSCLVQAADYNFGCTFPPNIDPYDKAPCLCLIPAFLETSVGCFVTYATSEAYLEVAFEYLGYVCPPTDYTYNVTELLASVPSLPSNLTRAQLDGMHSTGFIIPFEDVKDKINAEISSNNEDKKPGLYA